MPNPSRAAIRPERLRQTFLDLLEIDSPPGEERGVRLYCAEALRDAGFVCQTDAAGNLIAQKSGRASGDGGLPSGRRIFFSAHMDTVRSTAGLRVREEEGLFLGEGAPILGADDKAGLAEILEAVRALEEERLPHADLQVVFTTGEEVGLRGARALAKEVVAGSLGFVFDASGPTGAVITAAPTHDLLEARIRGRAAHAGLAPEAGISALHIACRAVDRMRLGRIDPETTANLGRLEGGSATNVVPEEAVATFEARSRNPAALEAQVRQMRECLEEAARFFGGAVEIRHEREYEGYAWSPDAEPVRLAVEAWRQVAAREPELRVTGGGSDANIFNARGVPAVVLSVGYVDAHTPRERIRMEDLTAGAAWAVEIARRAAAPA